MNVIFLLKKLLKTDIFELKRGGDRVSSFYSSKHERSSIECSVEFFLDLTSRELFDGFIENISESGFCLITSKHLDIGQEITISTNIFLRSPSASVCWVEQNDDGSYKMGMKFI